VAGLLMLVAACRIDTAYDGTMYQCPDGKCPPGYTCVNGQCVPGGSDADAMPGGLDAAPGEDGGPPDPPPPPDPRFGNVLFYIFDGDIDQVSVARDRGPHGIDAEYNNGFNTGGRYGEGHQLDDGDSGTPRVLRIADDPRLFLGNRLTIEAWVSPDQDQDQAIFSDFDASDTPNVEYSFELTAGGGLRFASNAGCTDSNQEISTAAAAVPVGTFTHVAVTWNGSDASFYMDGNLVETVPFALTPCEHPGPRSWFVGRRTGGANLFDGVIDELKVSDYPKSAAEIRVSMDHDSAAAGSRCGDGLIEGTEQCDGANACCDTARCSFEDDGTTCPGGTCERGVCRNGNGRVNQGLVALYDFQEGSGDMVVDQSQVSPGVDLVISDPASVSWGQSTLTLEASTVVRSAGAASQIANACRSSNEVTIEAWIAPASATQSGPARIITMSPDTTVRNFTLGQEDDAYVLRLRTTASDGNGQPPGHTPAGDVSTAPTHVVATRDAAGSRRMYVNGVLRARNRISGDFSSWDDSWSLGLGNELGADGDRAWLGTFHLVAVYCRALTGLEVARNFFARADPEL
jgi:Concanavalin A-like lectin/glucanases superfamily